MGSVLLGVGEWVIFRSEINVFVGFGQLRKLSDGACEKWILDRGSLCDDETAEREGREAKMMLSRLKDCIS